MKKHLLLLSIGALALGGGLFIGVQNGSPTAIEAKADPVMSNIYYVGTENGWIDPYGNDMTGYQFEYVKSEGGSHFYSLTLDLTKDSQFAIRDWEDDHNSDWMKSYDGTKVLQGLKNEGKDNNFRCTMTGNYTITYRWASSSDRCIVGFELNNATEMYFVRNPSDSTWTASQIYLHAWGSSGDLTNWTGGVPLNPVPAIDFGSSDLDFYRFQIPNNATGFKVKGADGSTDWQTSELTLVAGSCNTVSGSATDSAAGALIGEIYSGLGTFTNAQSQSFENSICAINATQRASIASSYGSLGDTAKATFEASTLNTYNGNNLSGAKVDVTFKEIVDQLAVNTTNGLAAFGTFNSPSNAVVLVSAIVGLGLVAAGFVTLLAKKKEQ